MIPRRSRLVLSRVASSVVCFRQQVVLHPPGCTPRRDPIRFLFGGEDSVRRIHIPGQAWKRIARGERPFPEQELMTPIGRTEERLFRRQDCAFSATPKAVSDLRGMQGLDQFHEKER